MNFHDSMSAGSEGKSVVVLDSAALDVIVEDDVSYDVNWLGFTCSRKITRYSYP